MLSPDWKNSNDRPWRGRSESLLCLQLDLRLGFVEWLLLIKDADEVGACLWNLTPSSFVDKRRF
tara:strand:+ start:193 stop:384 length:192 start_codon:yes stop_codon:yes gene_type:complete